MNAALCDIAMLLANTSLYRRSWVSKAMSSRYNGVGLIMWRCFSWRIWVHLMMLCCPSLLSRKKGSLSGRDHIAISSRPWKGSLQRGFSHQASSRRHSISCLSLMV